MESYLVEYNKVEHVDEVHPSDRYMGNSWEPNMLQRRTCFKAEWLVAFETRPTRAVTAKWKSVNLVAGKIISSLNNGSGWYRSKGNNAKNGQEAQL